MLAESKISIVFDALIWGLANAFSFTINVRMDMLSFCPSLCLWALYCWCFLICWSPSYNVIPHTWRHSPDSGSHLCCTAGLLPSWKGHCLSCPPTAQARAHTRTRTHARTPALRESLLSAHGSASSSGPFIHAPIQVVSTLQQEGVFATVIAHLTGT